MRKYTIMRSGLLLGFLLLQFFVGGVVLATPAEEAQLDALDKIEGQLELQRDWAKYRWEKAATECYQNYWVNYCLGKVRAEYRQEIDPIRAQEVELHEVQRKLRESIKNQRDAQRNAERAAPEKAAERSANQREYDEKQKDAATRAADREQRRQDAPKRAQENKAGTQID